MLKTPSELHFYLTFCAFMVYNIFCMNRMNMFKKYIHIGGFY